MTTYRSEKIHALEFGCQAPLKFYEHCKACPRFGDECPDLELGKEILRGKKKIAYAQGSSEDEVPVGSFKCQAPVYYFEKTRTACAHLGRCREEGLLLALLSGKKKLDYSQAEVIPLAARRAKRAAETVEKAAETAGG
jgi:hypothetical protein